MIRESAPGDRQLLLALAASTDVFKESEIACLDQELIDYYEGKEDDLAVHVYEDSDGRLLGFTYVAPAPISEQSYYLYWIVVSKERQSNGIGSKLLQNVEDAYRDRQTRYLYIETSSLPSYDATRRFYVKHGYEQGGLVRDYYADGDDMIVFRKRLTP